MRTRSSRKAAFKSVLGLLIALPLFCGCAQVSVNVQQALGVPAYPPTNPNSVEILRVFPSRPFINLATITVEPTGDPKTAEIEAKLRAAAAQVGANAAVIVADRTVLMGATIEGSFASRQLTRDYERVIDTVAIRYTSPQP